ncbi:MAG: AbrB/MazE/SpoVT family DNA-binding domain-containing protein [Chloroflexota bacterium]|nr:AbrB/MazE/SpoVT family DNA-binding domain-containing protein [Chloroflexota bacterium]
MRQITATMTSKGQVTVPAEVRRRLGVDQGKVIFVLDDDEIRLRPARFTLDTVLGSLDPLPGTTTEDFEAQIEDAMEDAAERRVRKMAAS